MSNHDDHSIDVLAKISALEYILEVFVANLMTEIPTRDVSDLFEKMVSNDGYLPKGSGPVSLDRVDLIDARIKGHLENFYQKMMLRRADILKSKSNN